MTVEKYGLPPQVFTATPADRSAQTRLQVDVASTGLFEGREFRVTRKLRLGTGQSIVFKNIIPVDLIIQRFQFTISEGNYEVHVWDASNVTENITFTQTVPFFPKNGSSEFTEYDGARYQSQMQIFTSGAVTTGSAITVADTDQYIDYIEMKTAQATAQSAGGIGPEGTFRYAPAGTFYTQITAIGNGTVRGVINNEWEERPSDLGEWLVKL